MQRAACRGATCSSSDARAAAVTRGTSGAVCAALALAAHAALLIGTALPRGSAPPGGPTAAVTARYVVEAVPAAPATEAPASPTEDAPAQPAQPPDAAAREATAPAAPGTQPQPDSAPPTFEPGNAPRLAFPDAPMPAEGVRLRAYVELEADGGLREITTGSPPGAATPPPGFQKSAERALRQARFMPGLGTAYCLLVTFEPDAPAPRLAWLPGAARDAGRCLTGAMPAPRELESAAAP